MASSEVCRAWMENDASGMVAFAGSAIPDFAISDEGTQAKCDRLLKGAVVLDGSGGNVDEEGTQIEFGFGATVAPPGVVLT